MYCNMKGGMHCENNEQHAFQRLLAGAALARVCDSALRNPRLCLGQTPRPPLTPLPSCSLRLAVGRPMGNNPLLRGPEPCCSPKPGPHACPAAGPQARQRSTVAGWVAGKHRPRPMGKHRESRLVIGKRLQVPCPSVSAKQPPITPPSRSFQLPLSLVGRPVGPYSESESPAGVGGWSRGRHDGACMLDH